MLTLLRIFFRSPAALVGATILALVFPILVISTFFDLQGGIENPYFSLLIYLVLGPLVAVAFILVVAGLIRARGDDNTVPYTYEFFKRQLTSPASYNRVRRLVYISILLISSFLLVLGIVAYSGHRYTDSMQFCGNFCHIMSPEFITHQNSPHSRVSCVACHIGKDVAGIATAKFTGLKQLYATATDTFLRPLPTPLDNLRPTRKTCEECHRPEKFHGQKLYVIDTFLPDLDNTHVQTAMIMKIGSGGYLGRSAQGIHWHISEQHQLFYGTATVDRQEIVRVALTDAAGNRTVYFRKGSDPGQIKSEEHLMDCIDCHNRPTHIYLSPDAALDQLLLARRIPVALPFIKREALIALTRPYPTTQKAVAGIDEQLRQRYLTNNPNRNEHERDLIEQAIRGVQQAYTENVFPEMHINWGTYQNFIGHRDGSGCFRCHDGSFVSAAGKTISRDCDLCHIILAENESPENIVEMMHSIRR
ncbi:MAG: NapC/NirT family cytochrome c [Proteobacteria bacterium]|nr:NapC/NirT family cytochrome c [Pseudomonadota bacterium]MBU1686893.1 NapC/NirT family cytochrome c [Pseudomonadota bacterium]